MNDKEKNYTPLNEESISVFRLFDLILKRKYVFLSAFLIFAILGFQINNKADSGIVSRGSLDIKNITKEMFDFREINYEIEKLFNQTHLNTKMFWDAMGLSDINDTASSMTYGDSSYKFDASNLLVSFYDYFSMKKMVLEDIKNSNQILEVPISLFANFIDTIRVDIVEDNNKYPGTAQRSIIRIDFNAYVFTQEEIKYINTKIFESITRLIKKDIKSQIYSMIRGIERSINREIADLKLFNADLLAKSDNQLKSFVNNKDYNLIVRESLKKSKNYFESMPLNEDDIKAILMETFTNALSITNTSDKNSTVVREKMSYVNQTLERLILKSDINYFINSWESFAENLNKTDLVTINYEEIAYYTEGKEVNYFYLSSFVGLIFGLFMVFFVDGYINYRAARKQ